ncbi:protein ADM2 [Periophthalmus magnuspinnatus]|uniref:protein ADM2 n=1 Tax=Periophthalmus magnuspinnatus TaxID=409849 RepID=UPI002436DD93|nr:protein ADM2 [Periophthalmus magnuspinnatus]
MCVLISAWLCALLGLLPLEIQSRALTVQTVSHGHRHPELLQWDPSPPASPLSPLMDNHLPHTDKQLIWRALIHKNLLPHHHNQVSAEGQEAVESMGRLRGSRGRRHVNSVGGRGHLMRVGCVLGTCQVQNLSHRLYQLIGQSGREDSSPINPRSPHSYG